MEAWGAGRGRKEKYSAPPRAGRQLGQGEKGGRAAKRGRPRGRLHRLPAPGFRCHLAPPPGNPQDHGKSGVQGPGREGLGNGVLGVTSEKCQLETGARPTERPPGASM